MTIPSHIIIKFQGSMKLSLQNEKIRKLTVLKKDWEKRVF